MLRDMAARWNVWTPYHPWAQGVRGTVARLLNGTPGEWRARTQGDGQDHFFMRAIERLRAFWVRSVGV